MSLKSFAIAAGAAALALMPSSAFALSAGILEQSGANLRILVSHGGAPIAVTMVAVDEEYNPLTEARAFPDRLLVTQKPRKVTMRVPLNTYAICAVSDPGAIEVPGQVGTSFIIESCARVNPHKLQQGATLNFGGRRTPGGSGLRRGLQGAYAVCARVAPSRQDDGSVSMAYQSCQKLREKGKPSRGLSGRLGNALTSN